MTTPRYGITVPFDDRPLHTQAERYVALATQGYTDIWSSEANGQDAYTPLAVGGAWAPSLRRGTAITSVYTRAPAVIAQTVATMCEASPGGFACGLGTSSPAIVEQWNGLAFDRPLERMRDMARFLRRALQGEKVTEAFDTFAIRGFQLDRPPETPPPILFAALRPGMLRLAEAEADGAIVNWFSAADAGRAAEILRGRDDGKELAARIMVAPTEDTELVYTTVRRLFTAYLTVPAYVASQRWLGREPALGPMWEAWASGDRKAALRLVPDDVIDALVVHGSYEQCRRRLAEYVDHGVTTPVLAVLPIGPPIDEALAGLAPRPAGG